MSIRTLIEINHDFTFRLDDDFMARLRTYLASGDRRAAEELKPYGVTVIGSRHHSSDFYFDPDHVDGFGRLTLKPGQQAEVRGVR